MAHQLGLRVIAEGVDKQATLDRLRNLGCDYAQGYLISRALPFDDFSALIDRDRLDLKAG